MKMVINTQYGYVTYDIDALWTGLYQMGNESDEAS